MENKIINTIWDQQSSNIPAFAPQEIIKKAITQRRKQKIGIAVMCITVGILIIYAVWQFPNEINMFVAGLFIMIASLLIRIVIEIASSWRKMAGKIDLKGKEYLNYLRRFYSWRRRIHLVITPICFGGYIFGLWQLFPYFKVAFSQGFYIYLIVSAIISLSIIAGIIIQQIRKELRFLKELHL